MDDEQLHRARRAVAEGVFARQAPPAALDLNIALWHVEIWWAGTVRQHDRLSEATSPAHAMADISMLVHALRNLLRAAYLAEKACSDKRIREAIASFKSQLPGLTEIRDVLEHFDEYAEGRGRFQNHAEDQPPGDLVPRFSSLPGGFLLKVGPHVLGAGVTRPASEDLALTVINVLREGLGLPSV